MDVKGEVRGVLVVDDFAHHPTAVRATIEAARARWPGRRLWAILEPRSNSMRRKVFEETLPVALALADRVVLAGVFRAQQLGDENRLEPEAVAESVRELGKSARVFPSAEAIADQVAAEAESGDVLVGDVQRQLRRALRKIAGQALASQFRFLPRQIPGDSSIVAGPDHRSRRWRSWCACWAGPSPSGATIQYEVSISHPEQHLFHVTMTIPDVSGEVTVQIPAWNALYQIRDFSSHVQRVEAFAGTAIAPIEKVDKQTWRVTGQGTITIRYATYWDDVGPFATQLER